MRGGGSGEEQAEVGGALGASGSQMPSGLQRSWRVGERRESLAPGRQGPAACVKAASEAEGGEASGTRKGTPSSVAAVRKGRLSNPILKAQTHGWFDVKEEGGRGIRKVLGFMFWRQAGWWSRFTGMEGRASTKEKPEVPLGRDVFALAGRLPNSAAMWVKSSSGFGSNVEKASLAF